MFPFDDVIMIVINLSGFSWVFFGLALILWQTCGFSKERVCIFDLCEWVSKWSLSHSINMDVKVWRSTDRAYRSIQIRLLDIFNHRYLLGCTWCFPIKMYAFSMSLMVSFVNSVVSYTTNPWYLQTLITLSHTSMGIDVSSLYEKQWNTETVPSIVEKGQH